MKLTVAKLEDAIVVPLDTTWDTSQLVNGVRINVLAVAVVPVPPSCGQCQMNRRTERAKATNN